MSSIYQSIDRDDEALIEAAQETLERCYRDERHTVAAAVLGASGKIYTGVNIDSCGFGPCAEPIAIGAAITAGEKGILAITAVFKRGEQFQPGSPCGNCRQLFMDYAPEAMVIISVDGVIRKTQARNLLPQPYLNFE